MCDVMLRFWWLRDMINFYVSSRCPLDRFIHRICSLSVFDFRFNSYDLESWLFYNRLNCLVRKWMILRDQLLN